jgi:lipopolysaccharide export system protein LptA
VELIGNVRVVSDDGTVLVTDSAKWSQITKDISTESDVRIEHEKMIATGRGGVANSDAKKAMLREDVTVTIEPDTQVDCEGPLEVDYNGNKAVFYNNVRVKDRDGELFSDKLTVNISPETKKIAQVVAEGNVKLRKGKSYTMSQKAIYTESTRSAKLIGKPRVVIDPGELEEVVEGKKTGE